MKRFAIVENGKVLNIAVADEPVGSQWVELTEKSPVGIGWNYDGVNFSYAEQEKTDRLVSGRAFLERLTDSEQIDIELKSMHEPTMTDEKKRVAAAVRATMRLFMKADYIDLNRKDIKERLSFFVQLGALQEHRVDEIVDAPVKDDEKP